MHVLWSNELCARGVDRQVLEEKKFKLQFKLQLGARLI